MAKTKSKKAASKAKKPAKPKFKLTRKHHIILGSFLFFFALGLLVAFISFLFTWQFDQSIVTSSQVDSQPKNWLSMFGASISHFFIFKGFGVAMFSLPFMLALTGLKLFLNLDNLKLLNVWFWGCYVILLLSLSLSYFAHDFPILGGIVGFELHELITNYIGAIGLLLLLIFMFIVYLVARINLTPEKVVQFFNKKSESVKAEFQDNTNQNAATSKAHNDTNKTSERQSASPEATDNNTTEEPSTEPQANEVEFENSLKPKDQNSSLTETNSSNQNSTENKAQQAEKVVIKSNDDDLGMEVEAAKEEDEDDVDTKSKKIVENFGEFDPTLELSNYQFPSTELLEDHGSGSIKIDQAELEANKNKIVDTLNNYKIGIAQIKATVGPTVTLYEIIPDAGIRISKIKNLEDDIALSLSALGIRIIAPIPGKGTIGIEVPNQNPAIVSMRSVAASNKFKNAEMQLPIAFGKTISNETFVVDLAKMPHLLMAGATGQGKSVGLNVILTSLLYQKHPAEVKFILVDPKKVELTLFNKIERHYLAKLPDTDEAIITDNTKVIDTLNSLCIEMDARYDLLKDAMVRNISEYNAKFKKRKLNPENGHRYLPYIVLVVDEFADLIMTAGKEVEAPIARLAQLARAIGIHLIIATQRPSVNVITGMIKANFPARIAFRVTSKIDSRTILDAGGADQLIGRGDMLFTQGNDLIRLQCAFVDTPEVEKITEFIGSQKAYPDAYQLPEYSGEDSQSTLANDIDERDKLFEQAAEVIVTAQQGSASLLQRKLKLGYNRAGRIIDQLEAAGIVGPFEGSKARQVNVPDLMALKQLLENEKNA